MYHSPNEGAVFVVAHHVIHELALHEEQLAADVAGVLPVQKYPVRRRHVPDPGAQFDGKIFGLSFGHEK